MCSQLNRFVTSLNTSSFNAASLSRCVSSSSTLFNTIILCSSIPQKFICVCTVPLRTWPLQVPLFCSCLCSVLVTLTHGTRSWHCLIDGTKRFQLQLLMYMLSWVDWLITDSWLWLIDGLVQGNYQKKRRGRIHLSPHTYSLADLFKATIG